MLTATACDAGIDRWADMRDAESGIRDPGSGMIPKEGSGIITKDMNEVVADYKMPKIVNSCEYEPWQNGKAERFWRDCLHGI